MTGHGRWPPRFNAFSPDLIFKIGDMSEGLEPYSALVSLLLEPHTGVLITVKITGGIRTQQ
jgi:hypothetical protein